MLFLRDALASFTDSLWRRQLSYLNVSNAGYVVC